MDARPIYIGGLAADSRSIAEQHIGCVPVKCRSSNDVLVVMSVEAPYKIHDLENRASFAVCHILTLLC